MEYDKRTGRIINNSNLEEDIVASVYANDGNHYLIGKNRKIYIKDKEKTVEIKDENIISEILDYFKPGRTDVIN